MSRTPSVDNPARPEAAALLQVGQLHAWYGAAHILFGVDLQVRRGEAVALMGRNGAGKSTTLKSIMGLMHKCSGQVHFMGRRIDGLPAFRIARAGLGYVPEDRRIFSDLTIAENLEVGRQPARTWQDGTAAPSWSPESLFQLFPNLAALQQRPGGQTSGGEQQMLTVARTLMGNPFLVLLDEPSEGVAPVIVEQMARTILAIKQQGVGVLLSEQNLPFARMVCDRAYVLEKGRIAWQGSMQALLDDHQARRAHLEI